MSDMLGIEELLERLDQLKGVIGTFAAREEKLAAEYRAKLAAVSKLHETTAWNLASQLDEGLAKAEADFQAESERRRTRCGKRQEIIRKAAKSSLKQSRDRLEQWEGRRKFQIQKSFLELDRRREADLAHSAAQLADFQRQTNEQREAIHALDLETLQVFRGYPRFRRMLDPNHPWPEPDLAPGEHQLIAQAQKLQEATRDQLKAHRRLVLPAVFRRLSIGLLLLLLALGHAAVVPLAQYYHWFPVTYGQTGWSLGAVYLLLGLLYWLGGRQGAKSAQAIAGNLAWMYRWLEAGLAKAGTRHLRDQERITQDHQKAKSTLDQQWQEMLEEAAGRRAREPREIAEREQRALQRNERYFQGQIGRLEANKTAFVSQARQAAEARQGSAVREREAALARLKAEHQAQCQALAEEWQASLGSIWETLQNNQCTAARFFPPWSDPGWEPWTPPAAFGEFARFGRLEVAIEHYAQLGVAPRTVTLPCPAEFEVPLLLAYPRQGSVLFETHKDGAAEAVQSLNNIVFRLLSMSPPGRLSFTLFDPAGLGQSFAGLMHLTDYLESQVNSRIWTQTAQMEEKLAELNEHMEKVIQMYLRNEYATISEYNRQAGSIAEKYHFVVVAGFPVNFSETAARRLLNIAASGARCGVFLLVHWDHRFALPHDFVPDELRKNCLCLTGSEFGFTLAGRRLPGARLVLDAPPSPEFATRFLKKVGQCGRDAGRVEVPFEQVAPREPEMWTRQTTDELRVAIGRSGATKLQYLAIGKGTRQHALIAGKTGSGKSTLLHVIITNLALWCSPEQVEFYLVDFKKGVEFKCYVNRRLPHARVIAIESDRQFGLSVLQRVDEELQRRGELFRRLGVQDLAGYQRAGGTEPVPRSLLIIDEFQEYFVEEDRVSQSAALLLDRIVRQGRAFGIHVLLGSQTLGGAYTLARATLGQMVIRVALQCNEADAYLIMDENNAAPRLLSRPGEGIYNDAAGSLEGNSPFQTVWLSDETRDRHLARIQAQARQWPRPLPGPVVFEGNTPADVRENVELAKIMESKPVAMPIAPRIWLGAPNSVKGPTEARFQRQGGNHLLVVGQRDEAALAIAGIGLVSLASQYPAGGVRFIVLDSSPPGSRQRVFLDRVLQGISHPVQRPMAHELAGIFGGLAEQMKSGEGLAPGAERPATFLFVLGLENFKKLRQEEEFSFSLEDRSEGPNPAKILPELITEGPGLGLHCLITCDSYANVNRFLGRKLAGEISLRVAFQMSANDSASLLENADAASLGLHRAIYYNEREGYWEMFRPYALPGGDWLEKLGRWPVPPAQSV